MEVKPSLKNDVHCFLHDNGPKHQEDVIKVFLSKDISSKQIRTALSNLKSQKQIKMAGKKVYKSIKEPRDYKPVETSEPEKIVVVTDVGVGSNTDLVEIDLEANVRNLIHDKKVLEELTRDLITMVDDMGALIAKKTLLLKS